MTQPAVATTPGREVKQYGLWIDGQEVAGSSGRQLEVSYPYTDEVFARVSGASAADVGRAVASADAAYEAHLRRMPAHERSRLLSRVAQGLQAELGDLVETLILEVGKPDRDARVEAGRVVELFSFAAALAREIWGEVVPMDAIRGGEGRWGFVIREPLGVIAAIGPFNAPLNLIAQKVAPALAAGNAVVIKPASKTPLSALKLARIITEAGFPSGAVNVVVGSGAEVGDPLVSDPRVRMVSVTGGVEAGRHIHDKAGLKRVTLELGSNAPNIVCSDADLSAAAQAITRAGFHSAGQQCISAQRVFVQEGVYERFLDVFLSSVRALKVGDPKDPAVDVGPMIAGGEVDRVLAWLAEAQGAGAQVLVGGTRQGNILAPTVVASITREMRLQCEEVFAPLVTVAPFAAREEAIAMANDSVFGLQAGVFTRDLDTALAFGRDLRYGCVWINEASRYRQDNYPFGGVKDSGVGREGVKYAIEEMTERKFIGIRTAV